MGSQCGQGPVEVLAHELARIESTGLTRTRRVLESPQSAHVTVDGRAYVSYCSNDYLGLAADPRLIAAAQAGAARHGVGAGASHLVSGHTSAHHALEQALAGHVGLGRALLFSSGYMANVGLVTALCGREDDVFADRLNHASLNDAALLSRARVRRYRHLDLAGLEQGLAASRARRRLILTDAVFSMDGDLAPLPAIAALAERHDAWLVVDDAHGFGVLGPRGGGSLAHFGLAGDRIAYMGTLGKGAGVAGAFVAGHPTLIEYLINRARTYIYTTAMPPMLAEALIESLGIVRAEDWRRERLARHVQALRAGLAGTRWRLLPSDTPIQPLLVGDAHAATRLSAELAGRGLLVPAIRPPTVPQGTARLRISLSAAHSDEDVARLVAALGMLA